MAKGSGNKVEVEEKSKEICCKAWGLEIKYRSNRSRMKILLELLRTLEGQEALDRDCRSTSEKFRELFTKIGVAIPAAYVAEFLRGGLR